MNIVGDPLLVNMPRTNYNQTDPSRMDYLQGKDVLDKKISDAQYDADKAQASADKAQETAEKAQKTGENALTEGKKYTDGKHLLLTATLTTKWTGSNPPYSQKLTVNEILATDTPNITPLFSTTNDTAINQRVAWSLVCNAITADKSITFYCFEDKPDIEIPIQIEVNR